MKRFAQFASCSKCGSGLKDIEWKPSKFGPWALDGAPELMPEELHVVCRCCGHKDVFTPLDAVQEIQEKGSVSKHAPGCNVWVGVQQCESPDESRVCDCRIGMRARAARAQRELEILHDDCA